MLALWAKAHVNSPLMLWIWGSVLVYAVASNALWFTRDSRRSPHLPASLNAGRFVFYLVIPYLALGGWPRRPYQGLLSLEDMGIVGLGGRWPLSRWLEAAGTGLGWALVTALILVLAWAYANRRAHGLRLRFPSRTWWSILIDVLYLEVHWAFYRGALAVALDDVYAGIFGSLALIYLEWSLNPFWRQGWRQESQAATCWLRGAMVLVIALLFFLSRNLWICLLVHCLLELSLRQLGSERKKNPMPQAHRVL